jgi:diguanylate cyclase (GGDEF)-like protein
VTPWRPVIAERSRTGLSVLMWLLVAAYVAGLVAHGTGFEPLVDGWLSALIVVVPALVCWSALPAAGARRREVACLAIAMTAFAVGNIVLVCAGSKAATLPFPSAGDVGFLIFYAAALAAIVLAVRREQRTVRGALLFDSLLGGLAAAAVLAVLLGRVFAAASGSPLGVAVSLAYPIFDLLLIAAVVGVAALRDLRRQRHWLPMLAGLALFTAADVVFALRVSNGSYVLGTPLDALWAIGLGLMAFWARSGMPADRATPTEPPGALAVPVLATGAGLAVLVAASRTHITVLAVSLATLTLIAAAGRTQLAFRQLRRLADLRRQATTDDLTGLPNRRAFYAHVHAQLDDPRPAHALLLLDLDRFKEVNDSLGHHVGDQLLQQVGARLTDQLRTGDLLARLGGDEFAVLLSGTNHDRAVAVAVKLRQALAEPFTLEGIALRTDVSIGLALAPDHGSDLTGLLRRADIAMYKAKKDRVGYRVYTGADGAAGDGRLRTMQELRVALAENQMTLHYQPKLDLATNEVNGVEALVRWNHPTRGLLYPDRFLPLIEDAGLMKSLTQVVLKQALDQAVVWQASRRPLSVAVNLSASSLIDDGLPEQVAALLAARHLPANVLELEITEEFLMSDRDRARDILVRLRNQGIEIAVDDFGTGYSSLAYLRDLPVDELKLDRSFILSMSADSRAAALVLSTIDLAHSLGLRMVAEGVEDELALAELTRHGCDQAQGYVLSRPVPAGELDRWFDQRAADLLPGNVG